ncbi:MAG TPA: hypothetical protein VGN12_22675 [Pirellulales bacterium]|jgi:hypothetical protein
MKKSKRLWLQVGVLLLLSFYATYGVVLRVPSPIVNPSATQSQLP